MNYYAVVFLLRPPDLLRRGPLFEAKNACKTQGYCVSAGVVAVVNPCAIVNLLPLGRLDYNCDSKTINSVSASVILGKWIWKPFKSVSIISGVQVQSQMAPITLSQLIPKTMKGVSVSVIKTEINSKIS